MMARPRLVSWMMRAGLAAAVVGLLAFGTQMRPADGGPAKTGPEELAAVPAAAEDEGAQALRHTVVVKSGDTLGAILAAIGIRPAEASQATAALENLFDLRAIHPGAEVNVTVDSTDAGLVQLKDVVLKPSPGHRVVASRDGGDGYAAVEIKEALRSRPVRREATIATSLYEAATGAGIPANLLVEVARAFSYDVDFQRDLQPSDTFEVLYHQAETSAGQQVTGGETVRYAALTLGTRRLALYRYTDSADETEYYTAAGESVRKALLRTPMDGARLSSRFGPRQHPILGYTLLHRGVDFAAATGTPIFAAGDGTVEVAGKHGNHGTYVRLRHNQTYATAYAHLSRIAKGIRSGSPVRQGQVIGHVGSTGLSTGPHLHYEVLKEGRQINPLTVRFPTGKALTGKELGRFQAARADIDADFAALAAPATMASPAAMPVGMP